MEQQYQKWVNLAYLAAAALLAFILYEYGMKLASLLELESRLRTLGVKMPMSSLMSLGSVGLSALCGFLVYRHQQANQFMNEVASELNRVTWPTQKETTNATIVVLITVLIAGMILGLIDFVLAKGIQRMF